MALYNQVMTAAQAANPAAAQDADSIFAGITREQYDNFIANFEPLENQLIARTKTDTSLIDQARKDAPKAAAIQQGTADRNARRYGIGLLPDQIMAQKGATERATALGSSNAINNARLTQKDLNEGLQDNLIDIGNGVQSGAFNALGSAASDATQRKNAYTQAKASSQAQTYSTIGTLASAAIFAMAF
jgi:hypothetical protein